jgi:hypothetical protein
LLMIYNPLDFCLVETVYDYIFSLCDVN